MFSLSFHMEELNSRKGVTTKKGYLAGRRSPLPGHRGCRANPDTKQQRILQHRFGFVRVPQHTNYLPSSQSPYNGSVAQGTVKPEAVSLTFQDAIELALKNNLGVLLQSYNTIAARGQKWKELSELLPNVTAGSAKMSCRRILRHAGLRFPGFPTVVGPLRIYRCSRLPEPVHPEP